MSQSSYEELGGSLSGTILVLDANEKKFLYRQSPSGKQMHAARVTKHSLRAVYKVSRTKGKDKGKRSPLEPATVGEMLPPT